MSDIDPSLERLLGKHLLRAATPAEEAELKAAAETDIRVAEALGMLRASEAAFIDSSLATPPENLELEALLSDPTRVRSLLEERRGNYRKSLITGLIVSPVFLALILDSAVSSGWGLATLFAPAWWWIPSLIGFGTIHHLGHCVRAYSQRELVAAGGKDWTDLLDAARVPLGWGVFLKALIPSLVLGGAALAIGLPDPAWFLGGLHQGWRHLIGIGLGYLATLPLWLLYPHADAVWLRLKAKGVA